MHLRLLLISWFYHLAMSAVIDTAYMTAAWRTMSKLLPSDHGLTAKLVGNERLSAMEDKMTDARKTMGDAVVATLQEVACVRHHWLNLQLEKALQQEPSCHQVVLLAAGLDVRAYYLYCLKDKDVYELDQAATIEHKTLLLRAELDLRSQSHDSIARKVVRVPAYIDDTGGWSRDLQAAGLDTSSPIIWIAEGLYYYMPEACVRHVLLTISKLPNNVVMADMLGSQLKKSAAAKDLSGMFQYGTDFPEQLLKDCGLEIIALDEMGDQNCNFNVLDTTVMPEFWAFKTPSRGTKYYATGTAVVRNFLFSARSKQ